MNYWDYNPNQDFDGLSPTLPPMSNQQVTGSSLSNSGLVPAGYDPVWIWEKFGDRLRLLPTDLYDAVFEAMRQGTILSEAWAQNAELFLPELTTQ